MSRNKLPSKEFYTVEFRGFKAPAESLLHWFSRELVLESFHKQIDVTAPLGEILTQTLKFNLIQSEGSYFWESVTVSREGRKIVLTPMELQDAALDNFLKVMKAQRSRFKKFMFTYGNENTQRVAITTKVFNWGFRARTPEGHRNFSWDKVDVLNFQREEPLKSVIIQIVSSRKGLLRKLTYRLADDTTSETLWIVAGRSVFAL